MIICAVLLFVLILLGMPIGFILGITGTAAIYIIGIPELLGLIATRFYSGANLFPLMAMPLFILAGEIMNRTGITLGVVNLASAFVGHLRGGLGHANVLASVFFAGLSGSAIADIAAIGTMLIPGMKKAGYNASFAAAITASSAVIGPIIPPSVVMVIYGSYMGVSISAMFAAGLIPGLLMVPALMICVHRHAKNHDQIKITQKRASIAEIAVTFKNSASALAMPVIILGGILGGFFTATEAGAVAVVYGLFLGFVVYRNFTIKDLWASLSNTAYVCSTVFIILGMAAIISWLLTTEQVPEKIAILVLSITENKYLVLLLINVLLIVVGSFMDLTASLIILGPVLAPLAIEVGVHPVHFGIIMCINLIIGLITPPVGAGLFAACSVAGVSLEEITKDIWPQVLTLYVVLLIITFIPEVSLTLPRLIGFID